MRLPGGWGSPHFFSVLFPSPPPLCTPAPLLAHSTQSWWLKGQSQGQDPLIQGLRDTSGQPQSAPGDCLLPSTAAGRAQSWGSRRRDTASTTPSPVLLLGFGCGQARCRHPQKVQRSGNIQRALQAGRLEAAVPARLGQKAPKADRASPPRIPSPYCPSSSHLPGAVQARGEERVYQKDHIKDAQAAPDSLLGLQSLAQPHPNPEGTACQACRPRLP